MKIQNVVYNKEMCINCGTQNFANFFDHRTHFSSSMNYPYPWTGPLKTQFWIAEYFLKKKKKAFLSPEFLAWL